MTVTPTVHRAVLRSVDLAVFDLDGTLYEDAEYNAAADKELEGFLVARRHVDRGLAHRVILDSQRRGRHGFLDRIRADLNLSQATIYDMLAVIRSTGAPIQIHRSMRLLLRELIGRGVAVWVLTNGNLEQQRNKLVLLGIGSPDLPIGVAYGAIHGQKPDPGGLLYILGVTATRPDRAAMIGDTEVDRECAQTCGVRFIPVSELIS